MPACMHAHSKPHNLRRTDNKQAGNLKTLEVAMTLLVLGGDTPTTPTGAAAALGNGGIGVGGLLDPARRAAVAEEANAAILQAQQQESGASSLSGLTVRRIRVCARVSVYARGSPSTVF